MTKEKCDKGKVRHPTSYLACVQAAVHNNTSISFVKKVLIFVVMLLYADSFLSVLGGLSHFLKYRVAPNTDFHGL